MERRNSRSAALAAVLSVVTCGSPAGAAEPVKGPPLQTGSAGLAVPLWVPEHPPLPDRVLRFKSIPELFQSAHVQLSNGVAAVNAADWRAVAIGSSKGDEYCTLTLVGPRVVLLAAHCVDRGLAAAAAGPSTIPAQVVFKTRTYRMDCQMSDGYRHAPVNRSGAPRASDDFAVCDLDADATGEVAPEALATAVALRAGSPIQLMGRGCTNLGISDDGRYTYVAKDRQLRLGQESVEAINISIYPGQKGIYARTLSGAKEPVLCFGDSGGPVMVSATGGGRRVIAVNSAVGATPMATVASPSFYSYLSPLSASEFRTFVERWVGQATTPAAQRRDRRICGLSLAPGLGGCRS